MNTYEFFLTIILVLFAGVASAEESAAAKAVLQATKGNNVSGTVMFLKEASGVRVKAKISGLTPGKHGFHIHEFGDCSSGDGKSAGGHFNPEKHKHGSPSGEEKHKGDLGNIEANESGVAVLDKVMSFISLDGEQAITGKGVIVHADADDLTTQPTGAAGARVACGVIESEK